MLMAEQFTRMEKNTKIVS